MSIDLIAYGMEDKMRYPADETADKHRRLLDAASAMFRARGLDGVTVSDVMKAAGMTHGAFYSHFENKNQMAETAISSIVDQADEDIAHVIATSPNPRQSFLYDYLSPTHRDNPGAGCVMSALAVEIGRDGIGRSTLTRHLQRWIRRTADGFKWKKRGQRRDQAILMTAAMVGAVVLARAVDDSEFSDEILSVTRQQLLDY